MWREGIKKLECTRYQEAMITRGLRDVHDVEDRMTLEVDHCMGYTAVLAAEAFKTIDDVSEAGILADLKVHYPSSLLLCIV